MLIILPSSNIREIHCIFVIYFNQASLLALPNVHDVNVFEEN